MQDRRPPRQIARELALLSISQLPVNPKKLTEEQLPKLVLAAVRTLRAEVQDSLETASAELQRSNDRILTSQTRAADLNTARTMLQEAVGYTQVAINQLAATIDFPELIQLANQDRDVRQYAIELVRKVAAERQAIDDKISAALVDWQVMRLAQIDRDILRIAVGEMEFFDVPAKVAINEAVELAKRYSGEDGHRFINGVLRKVSDQNQLSVNSEQLSMNNEQ